MNQDRRVECEKLWAEHMRREFGLKDAEATVETMTHDVYIEFVPTRRRHAGKDAVLALYRDDLIPSAADDTQIVPINRVMSEDHLIDELMMSFTFTKPMQWFLPDIAPTGTKIEFQLAIVVGFRGNLLAFERLYWDRLTVLQQIGRAG
jgi:carboxymethylenebutenolidase